MDINKIMQKQKAFFSEGTTKKIEFRRAALDRLQKVIIKYEKEIAVALNQDLAKSPYESYMTEIGMTLSELRYMKRHLRQFATPKMVFTPLAQFPASSFVISEPYGVVLIMSPWNYPFLLSMEPLIGAIAAGNCCVLKLSAYSGAVSALLRKIIEEVFPQKYVAVIEGGREENKELLDQSFDYIFFTGGVTVGRLVMEKASMNLTPVTLELGGKSPCIVDHTADLDLAAKRIIFGKLLNSGQTCVAPDYLLVEENVADDLVEKMIHWIKEFYGKDPLSNLDYPKIINQKHYERLMNLIKHEEIAYGGIGDPKSCRIMPTILKGVKKTSPIMQEEVFGPILPILTFRSYQKVKQIIKEQEKPLALYLFSKSRTVQNSILRDISFGGGCINDTVVHLASSKMPFGGVGGSGMGSYHGSYSFETFSHKKSVVKKSNFLDLPIRYLPGNPKKEKLLHLFLR